MEKNAKAREKIRCYTCDLFYSRSGKSRHFRSNYHLKKTNELNLEPIEIDINKLKLRLTALNINHVRIEFGKTTIKNYFNLKRHELDNIILEKPHLFYSSIMENSTYSRRRKNLREIERKKRVIVQNIIEMVDEKNKNLIEKYKRLNPTIKRYISTNAPNLHQIIINLLQLNPSN